MTFWSSQIRGDVAPEELPRLRATLAGLRAESGACGDAARAIQRLRPGDPGAAASVALIAALCHLLDRFAVLDAALTAGKAQGAARETVRHGARGARGEVATVERSIADLASALASVAAVQPALGDLRRAAGRVRAGIADLDCPATGPQRAPRRGRPGLRPHRTGGSSRSRPLLCCRW